MTLITRILSISLLITHIYGVDDTATEVVVLDTLEMNHIGWQVWPDASQNGIAWQETSWRSPHRSQSHMGYHVCSVGDETVDNWLRTSFVTFEEEVQTVYVNVSFFMRECQEYPERYYQCRTQFQVLKYDSNIDFATATTPSWDETAWTSVKTVPADHTYISFEEDVLANNYTFNFDKTLSGFYLAFRDGGMCSFLLSAKIWYRRCPAQTIRHTRLNSTPANSNLVTVYGQCVENADPIDQVAGEGLQFLCTSLGEWYNRSYSKGCACTPGYRALEDSCQACDAGQYKSETANTQCNDCPLNSQSFRAASDICACDTGYFRAPSESASIRCTEPPSEIRELAVAYVSDDAVTLTWFEPLDKGGRIDLSYKVECSSCSAAVTEGFNSTSVTLANLVHDTEYTVRVYSQNGVSRVAPSATGKSVAFKTRKSRAPLNQIDMIKATATSLELSWPPVPQADFYRVEWYKRGDSSTKHEERVQTNVVVLDDLEGSTTYAIKVKSFDVNEILIIETEETIYSTAKSQDLVLMISVAIVAVIVCMAIVIVIVVMFLRRSKQQCTGEKTNSDCEGLGPYTNVPFHISNSMQSSPMNMPLFGTTQRVKTYVDPHTYEDPRQAVKEFTKEINVSCITIEAVIGGGEFGDVCRGKLKPNNKGEMCVAIKTLKPGASEKNRIDFLTEASIMGQFEDPNVISLEGVITKSNPIMIVTEYMENGSLDTFLRANDGKLSQIQLLSMLHGISSGMTYLSEMSYIHRDLAARNILVDASLICKVADFGLSREVEYDTSEGAYTTRGGKIPVRWTAPEAIAYRKFTTASDAWSFGVVMWEMMSFGERPYWNWSNQDVIKAVDRGYRLPPPMECPEAVHQLMLDCWQKDRKNRPKFTAIRMTIDRLIQSPDLLQQLAKPVVQASLLDPEMGDISAQMTVSEWLQYIKMDRYTESFAQKAIHTMEQVAWLTFADLLDMGVTLVGHQKKIMSSVQSLRPRFDGTASPVHVSEGFLV